MKFNLSLRLVFGIIMFIFLSIVWSDHAMTDVLAFPQFKSKEEKQKLEHQALQGAPEASDRLIKILGLTESSDALYWASIAAENTSKNGAYSLGVLLSNAGPEEAKLYDIYRQDRKWFWLRKAADGGDTDAIFTLKEEFPQSKKMLLEPEKEIKQWVLSSKTLPRFKRAAMRGSQTAAYELFKFYSSVSRTLGEPIFWARIAAQNGHSKAPYTVGTLLLKTGKNDDFERAKFWLRKAAAGGDKNATSLLEKLSPQQSKNPKRL